MLNDADASGFKKVYLAMGFTDLRRGIDGLATIVRFQFKLDPYDKNTLFLFCGRRCDRKKVHLKLEPAAAECVYYGQKCQKEFGESLFCGISDEDKKEFLRLCELIRKNVIGK